MHHMWKTKTQFITRDVTGGSFRNTLVNKLPFEMHLPGNNFIGPGIKLYKRLNPDGTPKSGVYRQLEWTMRLIITTYVIQIMMILKLGMRFVIRQCLVS